MKHILVFAYFILVCYILSGQQVLFGLKGSITNTHLKNSFIKESTDPMNYETTFGYNFGFMIGYKFTNNFRMYSEYLFNTHNQKYSGQINLTNFDSENSLRTYDIPLIMRFSNLFYIETGAVFSFLSKAENNYLTGNDVKPDFKKVNAQLCFGFGGDFYFTPKTCFSIGARMTYGLTDIQGVDPRGFTIKTLNQLNNKHYETHTLSFGICLMIRTNFKLRSNNFFQSQPATKGYEC